MTATIRSRTNHPARFPRYILDRIALYVRAEARALGRPAIVWDPFAGVGRIHDLPRRIATTVAGELEPEWAACRRGSMVADAVAAPLRSGQVDVCATSCCYGSRQADHHEARDACHGCGGTGVSLSESGCPEAPWCCSTCGRVDCPPSCGVLAKELAAHNRRCFVCRGQVCATCSGNGLSRRYTYRHALGRMPSANSAATLQWTEAGGKYRSLHRLAWTEALRVLRPGGLMLVNVKNHIRAGAEQRVAEWHQKCLSDVGFTVVDVAYLRAPGLRHGENRELRVEHERIIVARKP